MCYRGIAMGLPMCHRCHRCHRHLWRLEGRLQELVLPFHHMGSRHGNQVVQAWWQTPLHTETSLQLSRLGGKHTSLQPRKSISISLLSSLWSILIVLMLIFCFTSTYTVFPLTDYDSLRSEISILYPVSPASGICCLVKQQNRCLESVKWRVTKYIRK